MKIIYFLLTISTLIGCNAKPYIPTPMRNIDLLLEKDKAKDWHLVSTKKSSNIIEYIYTLKGDSLDNWQELSHRTFKPKGFNEVKVDIEGFINAWDEEISNEDGFSTTFQEKMEDGKYYFEYEIKEKNEFAMWILFRGLDGIYMQSFICKADAKDKDRINFWKRLLKNSDTDINGKMIAF